MDKSEDPQFHLHLLWHALAERVEAQLEQFERLNRLMIETGVFNEEVILGPIITGQESGPPWAEDANTVVQTAIHLSVGIGIIH